MVIHYVTYLINLLKIFRLVLCYPISVKNTSPRRTSYDENIKLQKLCFLFQEISVIKILHRKSNKESVLQNIRKCAEENKGKNHK